MIPPTAVIIPFRDRGTDPLRAVNLQRVREEWSGFPGQVIVVDDGRTGDAQFNRSAAYNSGIDLAGPAEVLVFAECDMLIRAPQVVRAIRLAAAAPGLVIPFTQYHYLSAIDSSRVRAHKVTPDQCIPERTMDNGASIGAINVVSRGSIVAVGQFDEQFEGNWYDDNAMRIAFEIAAGPTRWVKGPADHLYHLPGWRGDHLTDADRAATEANRQRLQRYQHAETVGEILALTSGAA